MGNNHRKPAADWRTDLNVDDDLNINPDLCSPIDVDTGGF
jgi:hypothetical protein